MRPPRRPPALAFIATGLIGLAVFFVGQHYRLPLVPTDDFDRGIWLGCCFGLELMGGIYFAKSKFEPKG